MGKTKPNIKRIVKLVFTPSLLILIFIILNFSLSIVLININKQKDHEIITTKSSLSTIKEVCNKEIKEVSVIEDKIKELEDIDNKLLKIKKEFFENASKYESLVLKGKGTKKIAYLTVDDGPYKITPLFLDVFDDYDILATFFLLGKTNKDYDAIYKRIADSGHTVANHTYSHGINKGLYSSVDSFANDVLKQEKFLEEKVGIKTNILRFPGGSTSAKPNYREKIVSRLRTLNYGYVDWNVSTGDAQGGMTVQKIYNNVISRLRNKKVIVVLMHDFSKVTLNALPSIIDELKKRDYIFLPLFYESSMIKK
ncbi:MAG: polysaccharide deacetylase family protein [Bacilli bacterium]